MSAIDETFERLRSAGLRAFMPFVTAGDPDIGFTAALIRELDRIGCHLIEVGFPFSDPIADGPVIQSSYVRALERGLKIDDIFRCVHGLKHSPEPVRAPLAAMVSYTLIFRRGQARFLDQAANAGFSGVIVPDLPAEEAEEFVELARARNVSAIMLVTPTSTEDRVRRIVKLASGFVYCVSVAGITGERDRLPEALSMQLRHLRQMTDLPLCVGFGISKPEHIVMLRDLADGVIVGSAIVRRIEQSAAMGRDKALMDVRAMAAGLLAALNPAPD